MPGNILNPTTSPCSHSVGWCKAKFLGWLKGQRFRKFLTDWQDFVEPAQIQNLPDGRSWAAEDQAGLASLGQLGEIEQRAKPG